MNTVQRYQAIVIPSSELTAASLKAQLAPYGVSVVETCLGVDFRGPAEEAQKAVAYLRERFQGAVLVRPVEVGRGGDPLFRGYLQTDVECRALSWMRAADAQENAGPHRQEPGALAGEGPRKGLLFRTADPERSPFMSASSPSNNAPQRLEEPFWLCRDAQTKEIVAVGGSRSEAMSIAAKKGYSTFEDAGEESGERGRVRFLAAKMARCQFARQNFAKEVDLVLILYNDRVSVRCPIVHICGPLWWEARCPYGKLDQGFFSPTADEVYLRNCSDVTEFFRLIPGRQGRYLVGSNDGASPDGAKAQ